MKFSIRIKDLEVRSCGKGLILDKIHDTAEIIKWSMATYNHDDEHQKKNYCYVLAYWTKEKEGYDLKFVGSRPFDNLVDRHHFWTLAKIGQEFLDIWFEMEKEEKESSEA